MLSFASGELLAQSRPAGTTAVSAFTASLHTEITLIVICNTTGSAANVSIFHDDVGSTFDQTTAIYYVKAVPANDTIFIRAEAGAGLHMSVDGQIGIQTATGSALTFSIYGITEAIANG
jgi:hypothetical protein